MVYGLRPKGGADDAPEKEDLNLPHLKNGKQILKDLSTILSKGRTEDMQLAALVVLKEGKKVALQQPQNLSIFKWGLIFLLCSRLVSMSWSLLWTAE